MRPLMLLPYCCACLVNVLSCALNRQTLRQAFKVLLLPLLFFAYYRSSHPVALTLTAALILGWIGDILLIRPGVIWRRLLGTAAFAVGHCFYIAEMIRRFPAAPGALPVVVTSLVWLAVAAALYIFILCPVTDKDMRLPLGGYFLLLAALGVFGTLLTLSGVRGGVFLAAGAVFFLASDTVLSRQLFTVGDPAPRFDAVVMLTYTIAQGLLIWGFCR